MISGEAVFGVRSAPASRALSVGFDVKRQLRQPRCWVSLVGRQTSFARQDKLQAKLNLPGRRRCLGRLAKTGGNDSVTIGVHADKDGAIVALGSDEVRVVEYVEYLSAKLQGHSLCNRSLLK